MSSTLSHLGSRGLLAICKIWIMWIILIRSLPKSEFFVIDGWVCKFVADFWAGGMSGSKAGATYLVGVNLILGCASHQALRWNPFRQPTQMRVGKLSAFGIDWEGSRSYKCEILSVPGTVKLPSKALTKTSVDHNCKHTILEEDLLKIVLMLKTQARSGAAVVSCTPGGMHTNMQRCDTGRNIRMSNANVTPPIGTIL
jgi:hypothetical protein